MDDLVADSPQRYRHTLFSFLQRLPHTEPFRHHEATVMETMVRLLRVENEENAMLCIKVIIDGFRSHRVSPRCCLDIRVDRSLQEQAEPHVGPFLELVKQMYANTKSVVEREFGSSGGMRPPVGSSYRIEKLTCSLLGEQHLRPLLLHPRVMSPFRQSHPKRHPLLMPFLLAPFTRQRF